MHPHTCGHCCNLRVSWHIYDTQKWGAIIMRRRDAEATVRLVDGVKAFVWCCRGGLNSRPRPYQGRALPLSYDSILTALMHPYQGSALPLSYYSNCLRVIRRESSATQVKTRRVFFDDVSRRHDAETQSFWNRIWR